MSSDLLASWGLCKVGDWQLGGQYQSAKHLKHLPNITFTVDKDFDRPGNFVYAFVFRDESCCECRYVGVTTKSLSERFEGYRYGNTKKSDTDNRIKLPITDALKERKTVEIWAASPVAILATPDGPKELAVSKSLEAVLISKMKPNLNKAS